MVAKKNTHVVVFLCALLEIFIYSIKLKRPHNSQMNPLT